RTPEGVVRDAGDQGDDPPPARRQPQRRGGADLYRRREPFVRGRGMLDDHRPHTDQLCPDHSDGGLHRQDHRAPDRIGMMDDKDESVVPANDPAAETEEATAEPDAETPEARIAALEAEVAEHKDRTLRAMAEAENVRRRTER